MSETHNDRSAGSDRAIEIARLIDVLRADEGDSVTILCDNPDFNGQPNCAIECCGDWTGWLHKRFAADTLLDTLSMAVTERNLPSPRKVIATSNGHHWVQRFNLVCCRDCGFVRRADDQNKPCQGPVGVGIRKDLTPDNAQAERVWHRKDCPFCGSPDGQYSASLQDLPAAFFCKGCGINAAQPPAAPVETDEIKQLRAAVEYWRLAAERRDERRERTGMDIPEAATLDAPEYCSAGSSRVNFGPLDNFGPEDNDPGTAFIIHNVDDTVTIKVRSPGDRVFSEVEMSLDAWLKLRSVGGPVTSNEPQTAGMSRDDAQSLVFDLLDAARSFDRAETGFRKDAREYYEEVRDKVITALALSRPHGGGAA